MFKIKNTDTLPVCALCEHATPLEGLEGVLCKYKGVVSESNTCRKFSYDMLKRAPAPANKREEKPEEETES